MSGCVDSIYGALTRIERGGKRLVAWQAVYMTADGRLDSIGETVASPLPAGKASRVCEFTDGTVVGSQPDFEKHMWNVSTLVFDARVIILNAAQQAAEDLITKALSAWTTADIARALRLLLLFLRRKFD